MPLETYTVQLRPGDYVMATVYRDEGGRHHVKVGLNVGDREAAQLLRGAVDALEGRAHPDEWMVHET